jgi:hypothetical protein
MRGDYEEMEPVEPAEPFDWTWVLIGFLMLVLAAGAFFAGGDADGADPVEVALAELKAEKAVKAALVKPTAATPAPDRVVIVPGRWEYGADGLWRFYPDSPAPRGPVGTAADGRYGPGVPAPRPFQPDPLLTPTTNAIGAAPRSTSYPAAGRVRLTHTLAGGAGTFGSTNCTSFG